MHHRRTTIRASEWPTDHAPENLGHRCPFYNGTLRYRPPTTIGANILEGVHQTHFPAVRQPLRDDIAAKFTTGCSTRRETPLPAATAANAPAITSLRLADMPLAA